MNAGWVAAWALVAFYFGYRFYSRFVAEKIWKLSQIQEPTPAIQYEDGIDYCPAPRMVLFGHHYSSIAGAAPIVGPAVAVIWGWLPAVVWVVLGTIFLGAVHDFGTLILSMRHRGQSIGSLSGEILGPRSRRLFLVVIFFLVWMVIAVFALVIATLFVQFPSSVLPVNFQIIVALAMGWWINRKGKSLLIPSILALISLLVMNVVGTYYPISIAGLFGDNQMIAWIFFLMIYSYAASIMPVWLLLQPRDYINSHQLFLGLGALLLGLFVSQPKIVAPAINLHPEGAPDIFPFLFITIACGAISGFHGLVSSGTTSKQVRHWKDARSIGYGSMLGEGLLALIATLAATAGFASVEDWNHHYQNWNAADGLSAKIGAFVLGSGNFLSSLGVPQAVGETVIAVLVISFAATSLDTAARIQRYIVSELGEMWQLPILKNRHVSGIVAVGTAFALMFIEKGGKGGLFIWPLFGATNQMLASLSLVVISVYLLKNGVKALSFLIPMILMSLMTCVGLISNLSNYLQHEKYFLAALAALILSVQSWIMGEGMLAIRRLRT